MLHCSSVLFPAFSLPIYHIAHPSRFLRIKKWTHTSKFYCFHSVVKDVYSSISNYALFTIAISVYVLGGQSWGKPSVSLVVEISLLRGSKCIFKGSQPLPANYTGEFNYQIWPKHLLQSNQYDYKKCYLMFFYIQSTSTTQGHLRTNHTFTVTLHRSKASPQFYQYYSYAQQVTD